MFIDSVNQLNIMKKIEERCQKKEKKHERYQSRSL